MNEPKTVVSPAGAGGLDRLPNLLTVCDSASRNYYNVTVHLQLTHRVPLGEVTKCEAEIPIHGRAGSTHMGKRKSGDVRELKDSILARTLRLLDEDENRAACSRAAVLAKEANLEHRFHSVRAKKLARRVNIR